MNRKRSNKNTQRRAPRRSTPRKDNISRKLDNENGIKLSSYRAKAWTGSPTPFPKAPSRSYKGAQLTTRQLIGGLDTLNVSTGFSNTTITAATSISYFAYAFSLQDLAQVATLSSLFDQYRVEKLHLRFSPSSNIADVHSAGATSKFPPKLNVVIDRDDANVLSSANAHYEYDSFQQVPATAGLSLEFEPSLARALYAAGVFTGYELVPSSEAWVDIANTAVPFYGVKGFIDALPATSTDNYFWQVDVAATISFKNVR